MPCRSGHWTNPATLRQLGNRRRAECSGQVDYLLGVMECLHIARHIPRRMKPKKGRGSCGLASREQSLPSRQSAQGIRRASSGCVRICGSGCVRYTYEKKPNKFLERSRLLAGFRVGFGLFVGLRRPQEGVRQSRKYVPRCPRDMSARPPVARRSASVRCALS